ncbi:hypothetical protein AN214_03743 [Pseudoalteromonas sp. P1-9]|uniref:DUF2066 domain-containing protein n=1 Tax=Pseudoalteromonas sp. P1-9 TaxID=1710354 RepID=UPI0006D63DE3|nr:DUF2066 domain-containing protein [Pseudoalteromonas sp. P1-9]KPV94249.1 hypothetical protein AN214_03743 [Pseudoalteromonas sp. P1-9]
MEYKFNTLKNALIFTLLLVFSKALLAVEVTDLYQYKAVVDDKSQAQQRRANRVGFIGVLEKVSGRSIDKSHPAIGDAFKNLSRFVLKYEYEESLYQTYLKIRYQPQLIDGVLNEMEIPIWGNRRPLTLIWLAIEEDVQRSLVTKEDYPQIFHLLDTNSNNAGLPIVMPLLDLEDRMNLTVTDVWANFPQQILNASRRYEPEVIVSARLYQRENVWHLDWQFTNQGTFQLHQLKGDKLTIIGELVSSISTQIAKQYASLGEIEVASSVSVRFFGVKGIKQLEALKTRLRTLTQVDELDISFRQGERVDLVLYLNAHVDSLKKALQLDSQFEIIFDPFSHQNTQQLEYQWLSQ